MNIQVANLARPHRSFWQHAGAVLSAWCKAPSQVASICPSSNALLNAIADRNCIRSARTVVDLGPGTGETTAAILEHAPPDCRVLAIEMTPEFIEPLHALADPRLIVEHADAVDLERILLMHKLSKPDVIVSGIPFSSLPVQTAQSIMKSIQRHLADDGTFIAYQLRGHVERYAESEFGGYQSKRWVFWNLPPLRIYSWKK